MTRPGRYAPMVAALTLVGALAVGVPNPASASPDHPDLQIASGTFCPQAHQRPRALSSPSLGRASSDCCTLERVLDCHWFV